VARSSSTPKRSPLTPFYAVLGLVALVGVAVLAFQLLGKDEATTAPVAVELDPAALARVQGISIGREDAPVVIYEFADFQCPGCGQFASFVTPLIKQRLVEPGLVRYVYYDFPLAMHPHAFLASRSARCANDQGSFWEYHDLLYARQPTWSAMRDATDFFVELGAEAGLDVGDFEGCVRSDRFAQEVTESLRLGESLQVRGTPTLIINGKRLDSGIPSFAELEQIVRAEAGMGGGAAAPEAAGPAPAAGSPPQP
jgi:protein-disulfide isomerase